MMKLIVLASTASLGLAASESTPTCRVLLVDPSHTDPNPITDASITTMHDRLIKYSERLDMESKFIDIVRMSDHPNFWPEDNSLDSSDEYGPPLPPDWSLFPTGENVKAKLESLVDQSAPGDTLLFAYGGHGGTVTHNGQSRQFLRCTKNSTWYLDGNTGGVIWDSELNAIVSKAKPGVKVLLIIMACYSGYMARLPFRYNSKNAPTPVSPKVRGNFSANEWDLMKFTARYEKWSEQAGWYLPFVHKGRAPFSIPSQLKNIRALESMPRPMIICFSAAEYDEVARVDFGALPILRGFGRHSCFTIRMIQYIFGDARSYLEHRRNNWAKPIGQQFYMTQDSNMISSQTPVMTSNVQFDVSKFTVWDFMTKPFKQNEKGVYWMKDPDHKEAIGEGWVCLAAPGDQTVNWSMLS